jgi:hypothetical protein
MRRVIFFLIIFSLTFSPFSFSRGKKIESENENWFEKFLTEVKKTWENKFLPILKKIEKGGRRVWIKIESLFKKEAQTRGPQIKKEFKRKTEIMKKDLLQTFRNIKEKIFKKFTK